MKPIGIIHSPFKDINNMPIQPGGASGIKGEIELYPEFMEGLKDLEEFSHIYLIYNFHKQKQTRLKVIPFMDTNEHGVFATRSPARPNKIGLSIVKLVEIKGNTIYIENMDILDGTPLLDIKPYIENFNFVETVDSGWMNASIKEVKKKRSDSRFK